MIEADYQDTLSFLFSQLPMYQRVGAKAFKKDLTNIIALLSGLGNPHIGFKTIHVAGTNGKGTVSFMLAAILQAQGYRTGLYVSPHYKDFRERVRINGQYVEKEYVIDFVKSNKVLLSEIKPSFFEISVALAFTYFRDQKVDIAVIETGLGGRLDSTNVIHPLLSIITNISYDHVNFLGNTLALIAGEKAGIIKKNTPVVIGKKQPETTPVFGQIANQKNASLFYAEDTYLVEEIKQGRQTSFHKVFKDNKLVIDALEVDLKGPFQKENIQTVLKAVDVLKDHAIGLQIDDAAIFEGLKSLKNLTNYIGRWQILGQQPLIIADSGHNPGAMQKVVDQLLHLQYDQLHIVIGMVNDKDSSKILSILPKNATYYFAKANIPRGLDAQELKERAEANHLKGEAYPTVVMAFDAAKKTAQPQDLVFIGGSVFVVAEVIK